MGSEAVDVDVSSQNLVVSELIKQVAGWVSAGCKGETHEQKYIR